MTLDTAFTRLETLTTDWLMVRQMQASDAGDIFSFKSDPRVTERYGQEPHLSVDETRAWVQRSLVGYEQRDSLFWVVTLRGGDTAIGACCFWNFGDGYHRAEIGYELHPSYWHRGIMTEALTAILDFGFTDLGLHRVEADPLASNEASRGLLLKLGFRPEGTLRERHLFRGRYEDQLCLGLLREEWLSRPSASVQ